MSQKPDVSFSTNARPYLRQLHTQSGIWFCYLRQPENLGRALQSMLSSRNWTRPQSEWLKKLAAQTKANRIVDRSAIDDPDLIFKHESGGFALLNKIFDGKFDQVVNPFNNTIWQQAE